MDNKQYNALFSFIWNIANGYYSDGLNDFYNLSGQKMKQANGIVIIKTSNGSKKMLIK